MLQTPLRPWLALSFVPGMSSRIFNKLLEYFGSPEQVLLSNVEALKAVKLKPAMITAIQEYQLDKTHCVLNTQIDQSLSWLNQSDDHTIVTQACSLYPDLLNQIPDAPPLLYIAGTAELLSLPQIALVGSRNPGPTGRRNARYFAEKLSNAGLLVTSGLALGIDAESHAGALDNRSSTIAVLGSGIDQLYPSQNIKLANQIIKQGAIVSEFPLGSKPQVWTFPQRNRIISGLSMGTLVIEAALRSGSLITARLALEQGREVFAIPGSIHSQNTKGCHSLIKQGAKLVENVEDILEELGMLVDVIAADKAQQAVLDVDEPLERGEQRVLAEIDYEIITADELIATTGLSAAEISVVLMSLELKGEISSQASGYVKLK